MCEIKTRERHELFFGHQIWTLWLIEDSKDKVSKKLPAQRSLILKIGSLQQSTSLDALFEILPGTLHPLQRRRFQKGPPALPTHGVGSLKITPVAGIIFGDAARLQAPGKKKHILVHDDYKQNTCTCNNKRIKWITSVVIRDRKVGW